MRSRSQSCTFLTLQIKAVERTAPRKLEQTEYLCIPKIHIWMPSLLHVLVLGGLISRRPQSGACPHQKELENVPVLLFPQLPLIFSLYPAPRWEYKQKMVFWLTRKKILISNIMEEERGRKRGRNSLVVWNYRSAVWKRQKTTGGRCPDFVIAAQQLS